MNLISFYLKRYILCRLGVRKHWIEFCIEKEFFFSMEFWPFSVVMYQNAELVQECFFGFYCCLHSCWFLTVAGSKSGSSSSSSPEKNWNLLNKFAYKKFAKLNVFFYIRNYSTSTLYGHYPSTWFSVEFRSGFLYKDLCHFGLCIIINFN